MLSDAELIAEITLLSEQAVALTQQENFDAVEQTLLGRQTLIEQLVARDPALSNADIRAFLTRLLAEDQLQINRLNRDKSDIETRQVNTRRGARSINRYLDVKQF